MAFNKKILLVEDEQVISFVESITLKNIGYDIIVESSGEKAVETVLKSNDIDLILMDIDLGSGIDGTKAAEIILKQKDIPIIFLSNHTEPEIVEKTENITSYGYVIKNSGENILAASIKMAFKLFEAKSRMKERDFNLQLNNERLKSLVNILHYDAKSIQDFLDYALNESIKLTNSKIGYIYFYDEDKKQFILNTWSKDVMKECNILNPLTCYDLDKTGIWGEVVRQRKPIILNDFKAEHPLKKGYPEGHAPLYKYMSIPVLNGDKIIAVIGVANKETDYTDTDVLQLTLLMDSVWKVVERKKSEEFLKESEDKFKKIFDLSTASMAMVGLDQKFIKCNEAFCKFLGYTEEELFGKTAGDITYPDDVHIGLSDLKKIIDNHVESLRVQKRYICKNNEIVWGDVTIRLHRNADMKPLFFIAIILDITENKNNEALIRAQKDFAVSLGASNDFKKGLMLFLESSCKISCMDCGGVYLINDKTGNFDLIVHKGLSDDFIKIVSQFDADSENAKIIMKGKSIYTEYINLGIHLDDVRKKENIKSIAVIPIHHEGKAIGCLNIASHKNEQIPVFARKVLESVIDQIGSLIARLKSEELLKINREYLQAVLDSSNEAIFIHDADTGAIIDVNKRMLEMYGYEYKEVLKLTVNDLSLGESPYSQKEALEKLNSTKNKEYETFEWLAKKKDKTLFWTEISIRYTHIGDDKRFVVTIRDISERKKLEIKLEELVKEKENLLIELRHRIKNSFVLITGLIYLESENIKNQELLNSLSRIRDRVNSVLNLYDLLYVSGQNHLIRLDDYFRSLSASLYSSYVFDKNRIIMEEDYDKIIIDVKKATSLGLILNEFLTNALKYAFPDNKKGKIKISLKSDKQMLFIKISDSGAVLPDGFNIHKSKGLGMQIASMLISQLNGTVESIRNDETVFIIKIPLN